MNNKDNIAWRPQTIAKPGVVASFTYGTSEQRVLMEVRDSTLDGQTVAYATAVTRRYYFAGGTYEVEETEQYGSTGQQTPETSTLTRRLYLMGDPYSAPAVYVTTTTETSAGQGDPVTTEAVLFIGRDYQGSITHLINGDGTLAAEYSYDPWGRPRDPQTLEQYTTDSAPALLLGRGYTGHEWLPWFALYNANARLYDPLLGRFLEPDPYVQAPDFTQSLNRFAYCLNNPMKYSDESGEFIGIFLTAVGQFFYAAGKSVLNVFRSNTRERQKDTWAQYRHRVSNAWKIDMGLFKVDGSNGFIGKAWTIVSRFTYEGVSTFVGNTFSHARNNLNNVSVSYYKESTLVNRSNGKPLKWGMTVGSYINGHNLTANPREDDVFAHEYGHVKQSNILGPTYLYFIGLPSLVGQLIDSGEEDSTIHSHKREWYEIWANQLANKYYVKHHIIPHEFFTDKAEYPKSQHADWYFYFTLYFFY